METRPASRPVWPFILGAVLLLLLIVLVARSCQDDLGGTPPPFTDTLDNDNGEMMDPTPMEDGEYGPNDTTLYDRNDQVDTADTALNNPAPTPPTPGTTSPPGATPAVTPGGAPTP